MACGGGGGGGGGGGETPSSSPPVASLSDTMISELESDLTTAGYTQEQASVLGAGARQSVSQAGLSKSNDINLVAPQVLAGAELAVREPGVDLSSDTAKLNAIDIIITSVTGSLNGKITTSSSASIITNLHRNFNLQKLSSTSLADQSNNAYYNVFNSLTSIAIQYLDDVEIDIGATNNPVKSVVACINSQLENAGVSSDDFAEISKSITAAAVASLDDAGLPSDNPTEMAVAIRNVIAGSLGGLKKTNMSDQDIADAAIEIAAGATSGIKGAGVDVGKFGDLVNSIKTNTLEELTDLITTPPTGIEDRINEAADIANNEIADFIFDITGSETREDSATPASFKLRLYSKPTNDVTIEIQCSDESEGMVQSPTTITFTEFNWDADQTVTIVGKDDFIADGPQLYTIRLLPANSIDPKYDGLDPADVAIINVDDEEAGFTISSISENTTEEAGTASFTIRLNTEPMDDVIIDVVSSKPTEGIADKSALTFTSTNWNADQTVTVTGQDDAVADGNQNYTIQLILASSGDDYAGLDPADISVINTDMGETAGYTISPVVGITTEEFGTASFTIRLNSEPLNDVVIDIASIDLTEGTVDKNSLTFTSLNWDADQTVTITGVDDNIADGNQIYTVQLSLSSSGSDYTGLDPLDVSVENFDMGETAGYTISPISGNTTEEFGAASFTMRLNSEPLEDVVINVASSNTNEGVVDKASLTFTSLNWDADQTVTVTGVDDDIADGNQSYTIQLALSSSSADYTGIDPLDVTVENTDMGETAGYTISPISGNTTEEAGTATFTIRLNSEPMDDVVITVNSSDLGEGTVDNPSLTFTSLNWDADQTVTVTGVNDDVADGNQSYIIQLSLFSSSSDYTGIDPLDVSVENTDMGETAGYTISPIIGNTTEEGGTATFSIRLNSKPIKNVIISLSSNDTSEGDVDLTLLTFTPDNWNGNKTVTVTGKDDTYADGDQSYTIQLILTSSDYDYAGIDPADVSIVNIDMGETAGYTISPISNNTNEEGGSASFTVRLNSEPIEDVTINVSSHDEGEGTVDLSSLTFTAGNWNIDQTVVVSGVDDPYADGDQVFNINLEIDLAGYDYVLLDPPDVSVTNVDIGETAGFTISEISRNTNEYGASAFFTVRLNSEPTGSVVIDVESSDETEGTVSTNQLTFSSTNWNTDQTVTVTGVNDNIRDLRQDYSIILTIDASSTDATEYEVLNPNDVNLSNDDDDDYPTIRWNRYYNWVDEDGTSWGYSIRLGAEPNGVVVVDIESTDESEGTVSTNQITFDSTNWNIDHSIIVTGVDDDFCDGNQDFYVITSINTAETTDTTGFKSARTLELDYRNYDKDSHEQCIKYLMGPITADTHEDGTSSVFSAKLNTQPNGDVVINLASSDLTEGVVSPSTLSFNSENWNISQSVTVTGVDDSTNDGSVYYKVLMTLDEANTSDTTGYHLLDPDDLGLRNREEAGWRIPDTGQIVSYIDTFGEDSDYSIFPTSYTNNGDETLTDNNTNLIWQLQIDNTTRNWDTAEQYCSSLNLGGHNDWRLPTRLELISIVDYGNYDPASDITVFGNFPISYYWTSTTRGAGDTPFVISFLSGTPYTREKSNSAYTRCVRGESPETVIQAHVGQGKLDEKTGLIWSHSEGIRNWEYAIRYCEEYTIAGYDYDWRLPTIKELQTIVNESTVRPTAFSGLYMSSSYYWSSTTMSDSSDDAWRINFEWGETQIGDKADLGLARCVRGMH